MIGLSEHNPIVNQGSSVRKICLSQRKLFLNTLNLYFPNNNDNSLHSYSTTQFTQPSTSSAHFIFTTTLLTNQAADVQRSQVTYSRSQSQETVRLEPKSALLTPRPVLFPKSEVVLCTFFQIVSFLVVFKVFYGACVIIGSVNTYFLSWFL